MIVIMTYIITFLNSRLVGSIATNIANRFLPRSWPGTYCKVQRKIKKNTFLGRIKISSLRLAPCPSQCWRGRLCSGTSSSSPQTGHSDPRTGTSSSGGGGCMYPRSVCHVYVRCMSCGGGCLFTRSVCHVMEVVCTQGQYVEFVMFMLRGGGCMYPSLVCQVIAGLCT